MLKKGFFVYARNINETAATKDAAMTTKLEARVEEAEMILVRSPRMEAQPVLMVAQLVLKSKCLKQLSSLLAVGQFMITMLQMSGQRGGTKPLAIQGESQRPQWKEQARSRAA